MIKNIENLYKNATLKQITIIINLLCGIFIILNFLLIIIKKYNEKTILNMCYQHNKFIIKDFFNNIEKINSFLNDYILNDISFVYVEKINQISSSNRIIFFFDKEKKIAQNILKIDQQYQLKYIDIKNEIYNIRENYCKEKNIKSNIMLLNNKEFDIIFILIMLFLSYLKKIKIQEKLNLKRKYNTEYFPQTQKTNDNNYIEGNKLIKNNNKEKFYEELINTTYKENFFSNNIEIINYNKEMSAHKHIIDFFNINTELINVLNDKNSTLPQTTEEIIENNEKQISEFNIYNYFFYILQLDNKKNSKNNKNQKYCFFVLDKESINKIFDTYFDMIMLFYNNNKKNKDKNKKEQYKQFKSKFEDILFNKQEETYFQSVNSTFNIYLHFFTFLSVFNFICNNKEEIPQIKLEQADNKIIKQNYYKIIQNGPMFLFKLFLIKLCRLNNKNFNLLKNEFNNYSNYNKIYCNTIDICYKYAKYHLNNKFYKREKKFWPITIKILIKLIEYDIIYFIYKIMLFYI